MAGPDLSASNLFGVRGISSGNDAPEAPGDDTSAIPSALTRSARAVVGDVDIRCYHFEERTYV